MRHKNTTNCQLTTLLFAKVNDTKLTNYCYEINDEFVSDRTLLLLYNAMNIVLKCSLLLIISVNFLVDHCMVAISHKDQSE